MQLVSKEYEQTMKLPFRNRAYIRVSIGVINSDAQNNAQVDMESTKLAYFSNRSHPFNGYVVDKVYATCEQDFSKVDGSMYFLPQKGMGYELYNNGIVTNEILGSVHINFHGILGLDIKGLTIDFGEYYPTRFTIETDKGIKSYENNKSFFITEDSFDGTSYIIITPSIMVNGQGRLRIHQMNFGIANMFGNEKVISCSINEFVSPISDNIPSMDVSLKIDNQDLYYSVDNPESALAYMETGQEVKVAFGYDVTGNGNIEWLDDISTYLDTWSADDVEANFTSTDRFYQLSGTYYRGLYRPHGISLYELGLDVMRDAGITDEREFYLDPYLKKIIVYNPMPVVSHAEALQIIANAGRCILREDRLRRIYIKSSFVPDMIANSDNQEKYSNIRNLLRDTKKKSYAGCSNNYSVVDGTMFFAPRNAKDFFRDTGYVSESVYEINPKGSVGKRLSFRFSDDRRVLTEDEGVWTVGEPIIVVDLETSFEAFGLIVRFRSVAPEQFVIKTYLEGVAVEEFIVDNPEIEYITDRHFKLFDKMELLFTKGYPNSRLFIDNILIGDVTNYELNRMTDLVENPIGTRQQKIRNINVKRTIYRKSKEGFRELTTETVSFSENSEYIVYFSYPSYGFEVTLPDNPSIQTEILDSSNYFLKIRLFNITKTTDVKIVISGYEYVADENIYIGNHNPNGRDIEWGNPLISTIGQAKDLEEWLASYYLGSVEYEIGWRGDPRIEANDLLYLDLKDRDRTLIRSYQNELEFNGAWSGKIKARKAAISWQ